MTTTAFGTEYPPQVADVSFGYGNEIMTWKLLTTGTVGKVRVPLDGTLGTTWTSNSFNDATWTRVTNGIGFESALGEFGTNVMGHVLEEPALILKSCIGNRSLGWDLLPPGSRSTTLWAYRW